MRLLLLLLLIAAHPVLGQGTGTLTGRVFDRTTGEPLLSGVLTVEGTQLGAPVNMDGAYRIIGAPVGRHVLAARVMGHQPKTDTVRVQSGTTLEVDFAFESTPTRCDTLVGVDDPTWRERMLARVQPYAELQGLGPIEHSRAREIRLWDSGDYGYLTLLALRETERGWTGTMASAWPRPYDQNGLFYGQWIDYCETYLENDHVAVCQLSLDPAPDWDAILERLEAARVWTLPDETELLRVECEGVIVVSNAWTLTAEVFDGANARSYHYQAPNRKRATNFKEAWAADIDQILQNLWPSVSGFSP